MRTTSFKKNANGMPSPTNPGGPGHYVDIYQWNQPIPNGIGGLTLLNTIQLSTIPNFTRISQDAYNTYGFCITWENPTAMAPGNGINFVYGFMNTTIPRPSISPVYLLPGTAGETKPDVAFTHNTGLNLQFLYYTQIGANMRITESTIPMVLGGPGWPAVAPAPAISDMNFVPWPCAAPIDLKTRIDAPDHGNDNWAYSYILPPACGAVNNDIYVRYNNAGVFTTYNLTNGTMGILPCDMNSAGTYVNDWPVCSFDQNINQLNVEWYTQYLTTGGTAFLKPNVGGYVGLRMNNVGAIVSPVDFLQVATPAGGSNKQASFSPTIASSRQNDRTDYQFVEFANKTAAGGNYIVVKDRQWAWLTFKGIQSNDNWSKLYSGSIGAQNIANTGMAMNVTAYPNPFTSAIALDMSSSLLDEQLTVTLQDISGRVINKVEGLGSSINDKMGIISVPLASGMYLLKVQSVSGDFNKVIKVEKLTSN